MLGPFTQLGITRASSAEDIKAAYKILVKKYHPDMGGTKEAFIEIQETYEGLLAERGAGHSIFEHRTFRRPRVNVQGWYIDNNGVGIIKLDFDLMIAAKTEGSLRNKYQWVLMGMDNGYFEISKKDLARCNYNVTITFLGMGFQTITKTYNFPDTRGWIRKTVESLVYW